MCIRDRCRQCVVSNSVRAESEFLSTTLRDVHMNCPRCWTLERHSDLCTFWFVSHVSLIFYVAASSNRHRILKMIDMGEQQLCTEVQCDLSGIAYTNGLLRAGLFDTTLPVIRGGASTS
eukprot:TRINITY_DN3040_c0_g1_i4.p2 TRINITY_DN3040_c0_g1~~TRINITY_DN3040_c0_g1_i4.p2  ORF type:complete len:119 (-),score=9.08 TRINITY_DN3040_c0_g1_i4:645-1001(-)